MSDRRRLLLIAAGLFAVGLTLRPQVVAIGPLSPRIEDGLGVSHAVTGLLTTIPVLCMGLLAAPAQMLHARFGSRFALAGCLALIASFGLARAIAPPAAAVVLLTIPVAAGMAAAQAILPTLVKGKLAAKPVLATSIYTVGMALGGATSAIAAVPLANALGGWRGTLIVLSSVAAVLVPAWLLLTRGDPPEPRRPATWPKLPWRSRTAWLLLVFFSVVALLYYGLNHWLADAFVERGRTEDEAGVLVGVMNLCALPATLIVAALADRFGSRRGWLLVIGAVNVIGLVGVTTLPEAAWVWVVLVGFGNGAVFPLLMTLPLDVAREPAEVGTTVAMMLGGGYTLAAVTPFALGALRDLSGSFSGALWVLVGFGVVYLLIASMLTPQRLRSGVGGRGSS